MLHPSTEAQQSLGLASRTSISAEDGFQCFISEQNQCEPYSTPVACFTIAHNNTPPALAQGPAMGARDTGIPCHPRRSKTQVTQGMSSTRPLHSNTTQVTQGASTTTITTVSQGHPSIRDRGTQGRHTQCHQSWCTRHRVPGSRAPQLQVSARWK